MLFSSYVINTMPLMTMYLQLCFLVAMPLMTMLFSSYVINTMPLMTMYL